MRGGRLLLLCADGAGREPLRSEVRKVLKRGCLGFAAALLMTLPIWPQQKPKDLSEASLEDLMNTEVTSVSKKGQKLSQAAAAIFVVTQEDIRRSGATNIPDLLRIVPGVQVAQINSNTWAITARGFNSQFANKLLVLIDGRAVYTPLFGGVYWDTQDVPLEDVERIEVIRGPGGTVWGSNAVNGVINVITKKAADTQGTLLTGGGGTLQQGFGTVQYGGTINQETSYRIFTKYLNQSHFPSLTGQNADDNWHLLHGGLRFDTSWHQKDLLTIQGDLYAGSEGARIIHAIISPPNNVDVQRMAELSGGNVLIRWNHTFSSRSDTTVQFSFDRYTRSGPQLSEGRNTLDFDFQHHLVLGARQDLLWSVGYRHTEDHTVGTIDQAFVPPSKAGELFSSWVQDQITLKRDRLFLYVGAKLEHSYFTGFDLQPSARVAWTPSARHTLWAAISRAARTPTRNDTGLNAVVAVLPGPAEVLLTGNPTMKSEHVLAYEAGYRSQPSDRVSIDLAGFFNVYHGLQSLEPLAPFIDGNSVPPVFVIPQSFANKLHGTSEGAEVSVNWKVTSRWTLNPGYSFLELHLHPDRTSSDATSAADAQGSNPVHQAQLRSHLELLQHLSWDTSAYFVGRLPAQMLASYTRLDTQLTWRPAERLALSLVGQNLIRDHHAEFNGTAQSVDSAQVKRSVYAKFTLTF